MLESEMMCEDVNDIDVKGARTVITSRPTLEKATSAYLLNDQLRIKRFQFSVFSFIFHLKIRSMEFN